MDDRTIVTDEEAAAVQLAVETARNHAQGINTEDEDDLSLRNRVLDACDAAESFLNSTHPQGAERDMRDLQAALDAIGEAFAARQIEGDDLSYLRSPFESLEARLGRIWRRMAQTVEGQKAVEEARGPEFAKTPSHPATEERAEVAEQGGTVVNTVNNSLIHIENIKLIPDGVSKAVADVAAKVPDWITFLRDTLLDEKYRAGVLRLQAAAKDLKRGALGLSILGLREVLETIRDTVRKIEDAAPVLTAQAKASLELAIKEGRALIAAAENLRDRAYAAADGVDLTPWPTGMRLLPPPTPEDAPEDVELVEVHRFDTAQNHTFCLSPLTDNAFLSGGGDRTIRLWNVGNSIPLRSINAHDRAINAISSFSKNIAVSASDDKFLIIWNTDNGNIIRRFSKHETVVNDVAVLSHHFFASISRDGDTRLWNRQDRADSILSYRYYSTGDSLAPLEKDKFISASSIDGISIHKSDETDLLWKKEGYHITSIRTRDKKTFVTCDNFRNIISVWPIKDENPLIEFTFEEKSTSNIALISRNILVTAHQRNLIIWNISGNSGLIIQKSTKAKIFALCPLPSSDPHIGRLIVGGDNGYLAYWEVRPK